MKSSIADFIDRSTIKDTVTMIIDRLAFPTEVLYYSEHSKNTIVKIGWGLSLIVDENILVKRVGDLKAHNFLVSNGGTTLEIAYSKGRLDNILNRLKRNGFDTIELSEGIIEMPENAKKRISEFAHSNDMRLHIEIGKKNPRNQLSLEETIYKLERSLDFDPDTLIIEGRETGKGVEIFDNNGEIKWDWVDRIVSSIDRRKLMFEAPLEFQQAQLILRLGPDINLGNISFGSFYALETQRLGLRGDTFGAFPAQMKLKISPSARFVMHVLSTYGPMEQGSIMNATGLNRRTVQNSLEQLIETEVVTISHDFKDMRKKVYSVRTERSQ
ncbi:MAG: phosphosulfolactate synthase [Thermoplasmatales archaeon]|nr:phosphosulfolactate synthase [Thermoplasmatales archaeon]MCW6170292.1 phosphosulfolactate synthase [Thermoplasmatales archaeon]